MSTDTSKGTVLHTFTVPGETGYRLIVQVREKADVRELQPIAERVQARYTTQDEARRVAEAIIREHGAKITGINIARIRSRLVARVTAAK